jgi:8-oxo-dGTP pyrophosphatase MutT (NUDIX family)
MPTDPPITPPATGDRPATVADAATVVVVRQVAATAEVLMLRRSAKSPFMPSTLVFPGGRRDDDDGAREDDDAWVRAAVRECAEEANLAVDPARLRWFDTWMTPSAEPRRRYLARFYLAQLEGGDDTTACADGHETHDERWASVADHLAAHAAGDVDLPPPTLSILLRLHELSPARILQVDPRPPILPKYTLCDSVHTILMPHDPDYADAPGEGAPAPSSARLEGLPRRFVRDGERWRPG